MITAVIQRSASHRLQLQLHVRDITGGDTQEYQPLISIYNYSYITIATIDAIVRLREQREYLTSYNSLQNLSATDRVKI